jgi:cob(I)alamin adenosyltransferase
MSIYTKTGDKGETGLYGGKRTSKNSPRIEAIGTVDEFNGTLGVALAELPKNRSLSPVRHELEIIPHDLFDIGALLATPHDTRVTKGQAVHRELPKYLRTRTGEMEKVIDSLTEQMPPLMAFILPSGAKAGALLHHARTVCRRAERRIVALAQKEQVSNEVVVYINRLSDLLFTMARFVNMKEKQPEVLWNKRSAL